MSTVRGLMWTIHMGNHTGFLLGSIHCMRKDMHPLPSTMEQAFSVSSVIVFEANAAETGTPAFKRYVQAHGTYPPGDTLWNHLSPSTQQQVREALLRHQFPAHLAETIRPWLLSTILKDRSQEEDAATLHHTLGVDAYFRKKAAREGKQVRFLECATAQVDCFATLSERQQEFLLQDAVRQNRPEGALPLDEVLDLWSAGEADALEAEYRQHHQEQMTIYEHIVIHRNRRWLPMLEELLHLGQNVMIIVGGGHVGGPDGVVRLLTDKGYPLVQT